MLNAKPTFASSVSLAGDALTFSGDCVSKCVGLHACLWSKRASERASRETYHVPLTDGDYSRRPSLHSSFSAHALLCE